MDLPVDCAPNVAPDTLEQIAHVESRGDPLAIHVKTCHDCHNKICNHIVEPQSSAPQPVNDGKVIAAIHRVGLMVV